MPAPSHDRTPTKGYPSIAADDQHLQLVEWILEGIKTPEQRLIWLERWMPRTAAMLSLSRSWSGVSDGGSGGSGAVSRYHRW